MQKDAFYTAHPAVNLIFFLTVLLITAFVLHPVITGISFVSAFCYAVYLKGRQALRFTALFVLPVMLFVAVINPLFNHAGTTALFYFKNGNAVTLEAVLYGVVSAAMFAALLLWFMCLNSVMTSDKYVCLFGRAIPALSMLFSMALRFVPRFTQRISQVSEAQRSLSGQEGNSIVKRVSHGLSVISMTVTWALESAVGVSDSMRSRGYGLKGRTSFSIFRFDKRDVLLAVMITVFGAAAIAAMALKNISFRFYPSIKYSCSGVLGAVGCAAFLLLTLLPVLLNVEESIKWRALRSGI